MTLAAVVIVGIRLLGRLNAADLKNQRRQHLIGDLFLYYIRNATITWTDQYDLIIFNEKLASFWLDLRIASYTLMFLFTGERRVEQAVQEATLLQQTNGHSKMPEERKRAEIREINAARRPSSPTIPVSARARADQRRRAARFD